MCEDDPPQEEPLCVKWCINDALSYEEREEEAEEEVKLEDLETGLESMIDMYGPQRVLDAVARMAKKG
jgi:benzoyl-CoA reductase subunit BamC